MDVGVASDVCCACTAGVNHSNDAINAEKTTALFMKPPPDCGGGVGRRRRTLKTCLSWPRFVGVTAGAAARVWRNYPAEIIRRAPSLTRKLRPKVPKRTLRAHRWTAPASLLHLHRLRLLLRSCSGAEPRLGEPSQLA